MSRDSQRGAPAPVAEFAMTTRALIEGLARGDVAALPSLMMRQQECFERLRDEQRVDEVDEAELQRLCAEAAEALELAKAQREAVRNELDLLRKAHATARRTRAGNEPARFLSRRV